MRQETLENVLLSNVDFMPISGKIVFFTQTVQLIQFSILGVVL